jgi:excisionase family DNA binding protein
MLALLSADARTELLDLIDSRVAERLADQSPAPHPSPWMTVQEAATYLRSTPAAIYKRIKRGQLRSYHPEGSQILLKREDLAPAGPRLQEVL